MFIRTFFVLTFLVASLVASGGGADASHAWANYHWGRTTAQFTLQLGDNLTTSEWKGILGAVSTDWSASSVLDTSIRSGQGGKSCKATTGRVEVCNGRYGFNGWVGIAQIWISGSHITKGLAKMNDTYLNQPAYVGERRYVMCQEIGHTLGLGHTSEDGTDDGTCMDYSWNNETPNAHDFAMLESIYEHLDSANTYRTSAATSGSNAPAWAPGFDDDGAPLGASPSRGRVYVTNLPWGERVVTFIIWAR